MIPSRRAPVSDSDLMPWTTSQIPDLNGRRALVTGANSGLGLEVSRALAARGAAVVLACRNLDKGRRALA